MTWLAAMRWARAYALLYRRKYRVYGYPSPRGGWAYGIHMTDEDGCE